MLGPAFNSALSGIRASTKRLDAAAANLANINTQNKKMDGTGGEDATVTSPRFTPVDVIQLETPGGGTEAKVVERQPAGYDLYDPDNPLADEDGLIEQPNVRIEQEIGQSILAQGSLEANLAILKTGDEMLQSILDIKA